MGTAPPAPRAFPPGAGAPSSSSLATGHSHGGGGGRGPCSISVDPTAGEVLSPMYSVLPVDLKDLSQLGEGTALRSRVS